ncbi:MAG: TetR/AcrR family transcriptional regulator [Arachnia sp.]
MPPEQRREMIVNATLGLLETHGPDLTTRQIAEAAGVAEGTLFRVFPSLPDLLVSAYSAYLSPQRLQERLSTFESGDSLETTVINGLRGAEACHRIHRPFLASVHAAHPDKQHVCLKDQYKDRHLELVHWLTDRLEPWREQLTMAPAELAHLLTSLAMGHTMSRDTNLTIDDLARFALDGARRKDSPT